MSHRLVNLQPKLRTVENDVEFPFWTLISLMKGYGLLGNAPGVFYKLQFFDQLISLVLPLPTVGCRVRPLLNFIPGEHISCVARAGREFALMNVRALRRHEPRF